MIKYGPYLCKGHIYHTKFFLGKHLKIVNNSQILVSRSHRSMCHWAQPAQYRAYALIQLRACRNHIIQHQQIEALVSVIFIHCTDQHSFRRNANHLSVC